MSAKKTSKPVRPLRQSRQARRVALYMNDAAWWDHAVMAEARKRKLSASGLVRLALEHLMNEVA